MVALSCFKKTQFCIAFDSGFTQFRIYLKEIITNIYKYLVNTYRDVATTFIFNVMSTVYNDEKSRNKCRIAI